MGKNRLSDQIADQLEHMITDSGMTVGQRLPSERVLAERFNVSRPSLREAIRVLTSKGLVDSKQGGGTYIKQTTIDAALTDPILNLVSNREDFFHDVLEVRHALDGQAAYYAASRATDDDRKKITAAYEEMIRLHVEGDDPMREALADATFHLTITESSHNVVLLHIMRSLFLLLQESIKHNLDKLYTIPRVHDPLTNQHHNLMDAVVKGDPDRARIAAQEHLVFVEETLHDISKEHDRHERYLRQASILGKEVE